MSAPTSSTVTSTTPAQICPPMKILGEVAALLVANSGTGALVFKPGSPPTSATDGIPLDPASASGGQGGSLVLTGPAALREALYAWSTAGTTVTVIQSS